MMTVTCAECGQPFEAKSTRAMYCDAVCKKLAYAAQGLLRSAARSALRPLAQLDTLGAEADLGVRIHGFLHGAGQR